MTALESEPDFTAELVQLLVSADARAKLNPARLARSTLYDPHYHTAIIACAMRIHGNGEKDNVLAPWLKLLQFVAARPTLVDDFIRYAESGRGARLDLWEQFPRGYLGDETHEAVVEFLVASGILRRTTSYLEASTAYGTLKELALKVEGHSLFVNERAILQRLRSVKVSKVLFGAS